MTKYNNSNSNEKSRRILVFIFGIVSVILALVGATFAYFSAIVNNINGNESIVINTLVVKQLEYKSNGAINLENITPGDMSTSSFTVKNPNTSASAEYSLDFIVDENTFTNESNSNQLVITISGGQLQNAVVMDYTNGSKQTRNFVNNIVIGPNQTDTYNIKVEFKEINVSQNENKAKKFIAHIDARGGNIITENA